jgi:hypothetical protein
MLDGIDKSWDISKVNQIRSTLTSFNNPTARKIVIPNAYLEVNVTYGFMLTLCNQLYSCVSENITIDVVDLNSKSFIPTPLVTIFGDSSRTIYRQDALTLRAIGSYQYCGEEKQDFLEYQWSVGGVFMNGMNKRSVTLKRSSWSVGKHLFTVGVQYVKSITIRSPIVNASVVVEVLPSPLMPVVSPSASIVSIRSDESIVFDGSQSQCK